MCLCTCHVCAFAFPFLPSFPPCDSALFGLTAYRWPKLTLIGQSLGSMWLGLEALWKRPPHIFFGARASSLSLFSRFACLHTCGNAYVRSN
jgi:hypothetical protein